MSQPEVLFPVAVAAAQPITARPGPRSGEWTILHRMPAVKGETARALRAGVCIAMACITATLWESGRDRSVNRKRSTP